MTLDTIVKQRTAAVSKIFGSIDRSKEILRILEKAAVDEAQGKLPDLEAIADKTHEMRINLDRILVGFVESMAYGEAKDWEEGK